MKDVKHKPALSLAWLESRVEEVREARRHAEHVKGFTPARLAAVEVVNQKMDLLRAQVLHMIAFHEIDGDVIEIAQALAKAVTP